MVQKAITFITHPSVRNSSSDKHVRARKKKDFQPDPLLLAKVIFLRDHKGLTKDEIIEAYNRANLPIPAFPPPSSGSSSSTRTEPSYRPPKDVRVFWS
jgi:hypothetical protein